MLETSARLLRLLSLLQARRDWTGADLAGRLEVSERTVRRDVDRLRELGYPVNATRGTDGGYRLGAGSAMPPLLLDDEEAVAVAVGLRTAAGGAVAGIEETSVRALAKLEQVLPSRLRHRVNALQTYTEPVPPDRPGPVVDPGVLSTLAAACRDRERLRFDYAAHDGTTGVRTVEPHRLVSWGRRWYLVAWDADREDWRSFRVDRLSPRTPTGPRFPPRDPPEGGAAAHVARGASAAAWRYRARVVVHAPAEAVTERINPAVGVVEAIDAHTCVLHTGADTPHTLAVHLGLLDLDFEVTEPPELVDHIRALAGRYARAVPS
ncbi:DNA-binding transcriptional regulator [Sphaerisporangium krabiense]|uniref:Putative DNA-binding transcriptional regulator YafY n=1 Tax=Sphaerisporangium krabiense TaxID=763782 RepID=A0A7W9DNW3_9ACTN|nr:YafY family protein [Sphaerisporangium krabiense]MBB5625777.1 putative DNA-binding transcriptional regulator YafY [Sphaerisporangium krabiense]GII62887.1 DNA-binding transcriptional regulator [Sphaerisporangium krabiense]